MRDKYEFNFDKRFAPDRVKPLIDLHDNSLVERGPCRWCGLDKFMGRRNAEYCSPECQKLGKARSEQRAQARLKQRREKAKAAPPGPQEHDEEAGLSFLERRVRKLEREGRLVVD